MILLVSKEKIKILIACEESQRVCSAFRERGYEAYSCDILEPSGGHLEWHIYGDVLPLLNNPPYHFSTMDGVEHIIDKWNLIIAHPPCTYLTVTGNRWFNVEKYGEKALERIKLREEAINFFMTLANADCEYIAIENPVGVMSTQWRKPDQYVQPWWFGDPFEKKTGLWLKGLPLLVKTNEVIPEERQQLVSGKSMPTWYSNAPKKDRAKIRSKTFPGFANAMAEQWGNFLLTADK